ncbi:MAG: SurA N-terminal domain-containing protein, partial [Limisphaerales bacterium]
MFQFIRKHQAIGLIFIGIVIVSFVIFFSPNQGGQAGGMPKGALGSINGRPIDRAEYIAAMKEARVTYMLRNNGQWPGRSGRDWDEGREVLNRLFLLDEAQRLGVVVADDVVAERIRELPFLNDERTGGFSRPAYDRFLAMLQTEGGLSRSDFEQFMRHEVALEHLVQVGGMSGSLMTPREAEARYRIGSDRYTGRLVYFSSTNHLATVNLSQTNLLQFYSNRVAAYRIPERIQVRYVKFAVSNYLAEADQELASNTNLTAMVEAQYTQRGADSFRDAGNNVKPAEVAKEEIRGEFRKGFALNLGRTKANEFANRLYQMEPTAESLTRLATETGMTAESSPPFTQGSIPIGLAVNTEFTRKAFALSAEEPFATPSIGEDGVYVFAFERTIPSEVRPFQDVEASVIEAVRRTESRAAAEEAGRKFADAAAAAVAGGKAFEAFATEAGFQSLAVTNFSNETRVLDGLPSRLTVGELVRVAADLTPSKVSPFTPAADGGFVLHLESREPVPDETVKEALPEYLTQQRLYGRYAAFSDWERKRLAVAD